jgi:mono/diheme cytochrome c family protein
MVAVKPPESIMRILPLTLCLLLAAPAAQAAGDIALGAQTYADVCASCHGIGAKGDGPMSQLLNIPVPDLTQISARRKGIFPWLTIVHMVDGRSGLRGHGGPMPLFGAVFKGDTVAGSAPDGSPVITSARVLAVVAYLASIQSDAKP